MGFRLNHMKIGPFRINLSTKQLSEGRVPVSSVSLDAGMPVFRLWSRDGSRGLSSIDTPGQGSIRLSPSTRKQRQRRRAQQREESAPLSFDPTASPVGPDHAPLSFDPRA